MERLGIAYLLIALMVVVAVGIAAYWRYHSHQRTYARGQAREKKAHEARMAARNDKEA